MSARIISEQWTGKGVEAEEAAVTYYCNICRDGKKKPTKKLSQDSKSLEKQWTQELQNEKS